MGDTCVSVILPVFNSVGTVKAAVDSVLAEPEVAELIVVDDGSTDGSRAVVEAVRDPRLRIIEGPRAGIPAVYNAGLEEATGRYIAYCDHDDTYFAGRMAWQVAFLDAHEDYVAVTGAFATTDMRARVRVPLVSSDMPRDIQDQLCGGSQESHFNAWLIRREVAQRLGGRRLWFDYGDDLDFQYRIGGAGKVRYVPELAYVYRQNENSVTFNRRMALLDFYRLTGEEFARQRRDTGADDLERGNPPEFVEPEVAPPPRIAAQRFAGHLKSHAHRLRTEQHYGEAMQAAVLAVKLQPRDTAAWRTCAGIAMDGLKNGLRGGGGSS